MEESVSVRSRAIDFVGGWGETVGRAGGGGWGNSSSLKSGRVLPDGIVPVGDGYFPKITVFI